MKNFILYFFIVGVVVLSGSCKKDAAGNTIYKMSATVSGAKWNALLPAGVLKSGVLTITGTSLSGETILLTIQGDQADTYNLSVQPAAAECLGSYKVTLTQSTEDVYVSTTGKVVLTKVDKTNHLISGTFEFSVTNASLVTKQITGGTLNDVAFIEQ